MTCTVCDYRFPSKRKTTGNSCLNVSFLALNASTHFCRNIPWRRPRTRWWQNGKEYCSTWPSTGTLESLSCHLWMKYKPCWMIILSRHRQCATRRSVNLLKQISRSVAQSVNTINWSISVCHLLFCFWCDCEIVKPSYGMYIL